MPKARNEGDALMRLTRLVALGVALAGLAACTHYSPPAADMPSSIISFRLNEADNATQTGFDVRLLDSGGRRGEPFILLDRNREVPALRKWRMQADRPFPSGQSLDLAVEGYMGGFASCYLGLTFTPEHGVNYVLTFRSTQTACRLELTDAATGASVPYQGW